MEDVWDDTDSPRAQNDLDREWEARRQQFYNVSQMHASCQHCAYHAVALLGLRPVDRLSRRHR